MQSEMDLHVISGLRKRVEELEARRIHVDAEATRICVERDRYREALERIRDLPNVSGYTEVYRIASDAVGSA